MSKSTHARTQALSLIFYCLSGVNERYDGDVNLAYLCTPTDAFTIPKAAYDAQAQRYAAAGLGSTLARVLLGSLQPNTRASSLTKGDGGMEFAVIDGIVSAQGPNYALSKRLQAWRAMLARANGQVSRIQLLFVSLPL